MALYVDGFLLCVPKKKLASYVKLARAAAKVWRKHGALEYRECASDDMSQKGPSGFEKRAQAKRGELVVFSWIVYHSKAERDRINARVMQEPVILEMMQLVRDERRRPFDDKRMSWGGFKVVVDA